jgi:hypothetical protein
MASLLGNIKGPAGPAGAAGPGVPAGGTTGQILTKTSGTDYATRWADPAIVVSTTPPTDHAAIWIDIS